MHARIGVIPYSDDVRSGTIALWYTTRGSGRELRPKSEAPYVDGKPHGIRRSLCLAQYSAMPSLTMRAAGTATSSATV